MKAKLLLAAAVYCLVWTVASAQGYAIRVAFNTNLRASNSLNAHIVATAPAGSTLTVQGEDNRWLRISRDGGDVWMASWVRHERVEGGVQTSTQTTGTVDNCCFVDRQCISEQEWADGYWAFQNGQCAAPAQTQQTTTAAGVSTAIDNCCHVNRQCNTDQEWTEGYWAYQNNECGAPAQTSGQVSISPTETDPANVDNCCFVGWSCHTDAEWLDGFHAAQENRCKHPGVKIEGAPNFVNLVQASLDRLQAGAPHLYDYGVSGLHRIEMVAPNGGRGFVLASRTFIVNHDANYVHTERDIITVAGEIVHEACHSHQWDAGTATEGWRNEIGCIQVQLQTYEALDPRDRYGLIRWLRSLIANIENPAYWWW